MKAGKETVIMGKSGDAPDRKEIEEIISHFKCPKDFQCYKSQFVVLCNAEDIGIESFLECLEEDPLECQFSMPYGHTHFCHCPLRIYICKKLKK
jgi:hypothetical protein